MTRGPVLSPIAALALALALLLTACGSASPSASAPPMQVAALPTSASSHVVVLVMENKESGDVLGSGDSRYVKGLARRYGQATASYAVSHPSLPNYLALTSGSTHGITDDCTDCHVAANNVADQVDAAGLSWKGYMEDLPRPCYHGAGAGNYAKKHDPFLYYDSVARNPSRCRRVVPFTQLRADLKRGRLPTFAFVSPNQCNDTHDCSVATGDHFLAGLVPGLVHELGPHGFLVLTWDEGSSGRGCCGGAQGGRIVTIVAGPDVRPGARLATPVDHYGVLATIERALGLPLLGGAADARNGSLDGLFRAAPHVR